MTQLVQRRQRITDDYLAPETEIVRRYARAIKPYAKEQQAVAAETISLVHDIRAHPDFHNGLGAFMAEYNPDAITSIILMTLA